jgi:hypothetical protein
MSNESIRTTLRTYLEKKDTWFFWYHDHKRLQQISLFKNEKKDSILEEYLKNNGSPIKDVLFGFLDSTLDEARVKKANDFAYYALYISDKRSFAYFRRAESKREISGEIDYDKQRDHAVHTLYNYLLGWYVFDHFLAFREAFEAVFKNIFKSNFEAQGYERDFYREFYREGNEGNSPPPHGLTMEAFLGKLPLVNHFGDVWPLASLLHDVGYILEGSLSPATSKIEHERVTNGTKVLHDYYNHWLWRRLEVDYRAAINIARNIKCAVPDFKESKSMPALADRLRDLGNLENIRKNDKDNEKAPLAPNDKRSYALNREAFHLWGLFYKKYFYDGNEGEMFWILQKVKEEYEHDVWEGSDTSKINLNHGVCGGLLLLQATTFWYDFMWGLESTNWDKIDSIQEDQKPCEPISEKVFERIKEEITETRIPAHIWLRGGFCYMDWIKDLWATASVAIHDYVTIKDAWNRDGNKKLKIDLHKDPLAYLEILVDVLQEWDRYTVLGESAFSEAELLQSYKTRLSLMDVYNKPKLRLTYPKFNPKRKNSKNYKKELEDNLKRVLKGWNNYVDIIEE